MANNIASVNANEGITNVVNEKELRDTMISTFTSLADVLAKHCGPYSGTAILTNPNNPMAEPIFTKDGINIVSSIKYASVLQDFVRMQLAYMGTRIERSAGDGTTSAMMVMAYTIAELIGTLSKSEDSFSMEDLTTAWDALVSMIEDKYKKVRNFAESLEKKEQIAYVAGSQAYTSSHGDIELAKCISNLFANTPKEVWDTLVVQKASYESETKYRVTVKDSQYTLDDVILFPNKRNKDLGTVLDLKDANCLVRNYLNLGDDTQKFVHEFIENSVKEGTQLLVITCNDMDTYTRNHYSELFGEHPDHKVMFVLVPFADGKLNDITALDVIRAQKNGPLNMEELNVFKADVCCEGSSFRFTSGLFEKTDTDVNPYYKNVLYPVFNEFVRQIEQIIEKEKSDISSKNVKAIERFTRILYKLKATKDVTFTVGGAAYDNAAGQDIAMDALLATKCSLTKGFTTGRFSYLRGELCQIYNETGMTTKNSRLIRCYCYTLIQAISRINVALYRYLPKRLRKIAEEYTVSPIDFTKLGDPSYRPPKSLSEALKEMKDYCIIQPAQTDITFMKRFGEVGLKFLKANQVITSGYYYVDNKEK